MGSANICAEFGDEAPKGQANKKRRFAAFFTQNRFFRLTPH